MAFVIGGTSAEATLKTVKLASTKYYDGLPTEGNEYGQAFRDVQLEKNCSKKRRILAWARSSAANTFAHDIRVVRLPRHGASCPVGMGVSALRTATSRQKSTKTASGLRKLEHNRASTSRKNCVRRVRGKREGEPEPPMKEILAQLSDFPVSTRLSLTGTIIVARDIAHAKLKNVSITAKICRST
ncbi:Fumarate hydratase class I, anaerobic [Cedecea neteri]|uniref:Fumarate hydratase class I, anaerobic n=1 Tax=Cedecea neteri TaxID=158822 RepID=A0A2X3JB19_9ENTR|nr:Fumarate hydratase class I, anaerobic [Cedecea neteri]